MFGKKKTWQKATGTVLARTIASTDSDGAMITYNYAVEVHPTDGAAFRAMLKDPRMLTDFLQPIVGKTVGVEFDAASGTARFDKSDPQLSFKAFERAQQDTMRRALHPDAP